MERVLATALPLAFLAQLRISEAVLAGRHISMDGHPPIEGRLFYLSKYLIILIWSGTALQSRGIGLPVLAGPSALRWVSVGLWMLGFTILSLGRIQLGAQVRLGIPDEATALQTRGVYRFSRNPMYLGLDATIVASVLCTRNPVVFGLALFVIAVHHRIILDEEHWLIGTFGEAYERYRVHVRRYL